MKEQVEVWKDITGYEGLYQVSNLGRVKSLDKFRIGKRNARTFVKGKMLIKTIAKNGYEAIGLSNNNHYKLWLVHRLVAISFIPNPNEHPCVDHINGDRKDNRCSNLRWCTHKENLNYELARNNISKSQKNNEKCILHRRSIQAACRKPVVIVSPNGTMKEYALLADVEKDGFNRHTVSNCCISGKPIGKRKFKGYKCYWKDNYEGSRT